MWPIARLRSMNSAKSWLPTMFQCPERSCEKSLPATPSSDGAGGEIYAPPYISQFSFYGLLNPSKTSKIIIWPNLKNHPEKMEDLQKHLKIWQKQGWLVQTWQCRSTGKMPRKKKSPRTGCIATWQGPTTVWPTVTTVEKVKASEARHGIIKSRKKLGYFPGFSWNDAFSEGHGCFLTTGALRKTCPDYT